MQRRYTTISTDFNESGAIFFLLVLKLERVKTKSESLLKSVQMTLTLYKRSVADP